MNQTENQNNSVKKEQSTKKGNTRIIVAGFLVIVLLTVLQFFLISTLGDDSLKPLDKKEVHDISVTRVLDLNFSYLREADFDDYLKLVQKLVLDKLGYRIRLKLRKTILINNYISHDDSFFDTDAARTWLRKELSVTGSVQSNFKWLASFLADKAQAALLAKFYNVTKSTNLQQAVEQEFLRRVKQNLTIKNRKGAPVYYDSRKIAPSASAYWAYLLAMQTASDFVVSNVPIFFPSKKLPLDAITRGGLVVNKLVSSRTVYGGALAFSFYPVLSQQGENKQKVVLAAGLTLQGMARLLGRFALDYTNQKSLLFPVLGYKFSKWWSNGQRAIVPPGSRVLTHFK